VILRTYGIGDGPVNNKDFIEVLHYLRDKDIVVLNVSQCLKGRINDHAYATGSILKRCKVVSGRDMTFEAAYCKLMFLLSRTKNTNVIRRDLHKDMCGELSMYLTMKNFVSEL
jgi:L-asparaginase